MTLYDHPRLRELLAGILADPGSDVVRLAWADALAELGDGDRAAQERAEFVRLQVAAAAWGTCPGAPHGPPGSPPPARCVCADRVAVRRRERELLRHHYLGWLNVGALCVHFNEEGTTPTVAIGLTSWQALDTELTFRRGFVERVAMPASALPHLDAARACQPVTAVTLTTWPDPAELTALTIRRGKQPGVADAEETSATRWRLKRLWPGIEEWTLPAPGVPGPFIFSSYR